MCYNADDNLVLGCCGIVMCEPCAKVHICKWEHCNASQCCLQVGPPTNQTTFDDLIAFYTDLLARFEPHVLFRSVRDCKRPHVLMAPFDIYPRHLEACILRNLYNVFKQHLFCCSTSGHFFLPGKSKTITPQPTLPSPHTSHPIPQNGSFNQVTHGRLSGQHYQCSCKQGQWPRNSHLRRDRPRVL